MVSFTAIFTAALAAASVAVAAPMEKRASGQATYFYQNGNPGACGTYSNDYEKVVALDYRMYSGDKCGKTVTITNTDSQSTFSFSLFLAILLIEVSNTRWKDRQRHRS